MSQDDRLTLALQEFSSLRDRLKQSGFSAEYVAENALKVTPAEGSSNLSKKEIGLCFAGLTHGDEVAGLLVINEIMKKLASGEVKTKATLAFVLGNVPAALANKRFLERDLNRAFCVANPTHKEEKRALELEKLFSKCEFIFDMHQTIQPSASAFFLFEYRSQAQLDLVQRIDPSLPIVVSLSTFSADGLGIEEFALPLGGITITVELGQMGFHKSQVENGLRLALRFLRALEAPAEKALGDLTNPLYTWDYTGRFVDTEASLDPGWVNFAHVDVGQRLGKNGEQILRAPCSGSMLFPKYTPPLNREVDLFRILKRLQPSDLLKTKS